MATAVSKKKKKREKVGGMDERQSQYAAAVQQSIKNGDLLNAEQLLRQVRTEFPLQAQAIYLSGCVAFLQEKYAEAQSFFTKALEIEPQNPVFFNNRAASWERLENETEAETDYRQAIENDGLYAEARLNLAKLYERQGRYQEGLTVLQPLTEQQNKTIGVQQLRGTLYEKMMRWEESIAAYCAELELQPHARETIASLSALLLERGKSDEAIERLTQALKIHSNDCILLNNLAGAYLQQGRAEKALYYYQQAESVNHEQRKEIGSNMLLTLNYLPLPENEIYQAHRQWGQRYPNVETFFANDRREERRLRVGYVSPDFYSHSVMYFFEAVLEHHDQTKVEIFLYNSQSYYFDETTMRLQRRAAGWREISGLSDEQAKSLIQQDGIDILVDLTGHCAKNRLSLFALKPAPIQVSWIGYPNTTGLEQIDYRFTDAIADPPGETDRYYTEKLVRLSDSFLCYRPREGIAAVAEPPCAKQEGLVLASFNNLAKVTPELVALWSRILRRLPQARLLLKARGADDPAVQRMFHSLFSAQGVSQEQLLFAGRCTNSEEHFACYNEVDIALDTFPYHGVTTTCDALWMGVPVITLAGRSHVARVGASLLKNVGLERFIAGNSDEYVEKTVALAVNREELRQLRRTLRDQLRQSPLLNAAKLAKNVETEYFSMWRTWLAKEAQNTDAVKKTVDVEKIEPLPQRAAGRDLQAATYYRIATKAKEQQQWAEAIQAYRQVLALVQEHPEAHASLAAVLHHVGSLDEAREHYRKAVQLNPSNYALLNNYALLLRNDGNEMEAIRLLEQAVERKPDYLSACVQLLELQRRIGRWDQVIRWGEQILALDPNHLQALCLLGEAYKGRGRRKEAKACLEKALTLKPDDVELLNSMGMLLEESGEISQAIAIYERALAIRPDEAIVYCNLATCLAKQGKGEETLSCFRKALALKPDMAKLHSNILLALAYLPTVNAEQIYLEHLQWAKQHAEALYPKLSEVSARRRSKSNRLRIGYVSPDIRNHSVAYFIQGVLQKHDRSQFQVFLYADVKFPDSTTVHIARMAEVCRDVSRMNDDQLYEQIVQDEVDILIDLAGHTAENRMVLFARKPAPLQVTWIGYPNTTGLATMDYRLTDHYADPIGLTERFHTEKLLRLPECFLCYQPHPDSPDAASAPCLKNGYITFGSFNNFNKVSDQIIALWSRILTEVPGSRLLIKASGFGDEYVRERTVAAFERLGIDRERIIMSGPIPAYRDHLAKYHDVDIALDTYPYHGATTTCEALWMGVPVITLAGNTHVSRVGVSLLSAVGLDEWIAVTEEQYVEFAKTLAADVHEIERLHQSLRGRMQNSPLMLAERFAKNLEAVYRRIWQRKEWGEEAAKQQEPLSDRDRIVAGQLFAQQKWQEAASAYRGILAMQSTDLEALHGLGICLGKLGDTAAGVALLQQALQCGAEPFAISYNIGLLLMQDRQERSAVKWLEQASALRPEHAGAHGNLARCYRQLKEIGKAAQEYQKTLQLMPEAIELILEIGYFLSLCGQGSHALDVLRSGLAISPNHAPLLQMMGFACKMAGNAEQGLAFYRQAVECDPNLTACRNQILSTLNYLPQWTPAEVYQEHLQWGRAYEQNKRRFFSYQNKAKSERLKIGYVSADFRRHSVAFFLQSVLTHYDRTKYEVTLYSNNGMLCDEVTDRLKELTDHWIDISTLSDEDAAQRIHDDGVNLLVDLSGHTGGNRLAIFAQKPAPIQLTWLGYPNTTGLQAMDYRITDQHADPPGKTEGLHTERLIRLPNCFLAYLPPDVERSYDLELPQERAKIVTFGSFNDLAKINEPLLNLWGRILRETPNSRLLLKAIGLADVAAQERIYTAFEEQGIGKERVVMMGQKAELEQHLALYRQIDIALDTYPYNGATTTCEALWMNVPVITLAGPSHVSRVGVSLLANVGLEEWIAKDADEYVRLAATLAMQPERLRQIRTKLYEGMEQSILLDGLQFTQELEKKYRNVWEEWQARGETGRQP